MLPQVVVLVAGGAFVNPFVRGVGLGAALVDTATEVASGVGIAVTGTLLAALSTGDIATPTWSALQTAEFREAVMIAGLALTAAAAALVGWRFARSSVVVHARR